MSEKHGIDKQCKWHGSDIPVDDEFSCGCQNGCGMYAVKECEGCGKTFLDWSYKGWDDVVVGPYATSSGDLYCTRCGPAHERAQEEWDQQDHPW